jgi:hypothetical protein
MARGYTPSFAAYPYNASDHILGTTHAAAHKPGQQVFGPFGTGQWISADLEFLVTSGAGVDLARLDPVPQVLIDNAHRGRL